MIPPKTGEVVDQEVEDIEVPEGEADPAAPKVVDLDEEDANDEATAKVNRLDQAERNKAFAAMRKEAADAKRERDEFKRKVADYEARQAAPTAQPQYAPAVPQRQREYIGGIPVPETDAEWDALARQNWRTAVDLRSTIKARAIQQEYAASSKEASTLEDTKQKVLSKHPDLNDPNSEKGKIFLSVLDKNPEYLKMSKGPLFAMREMEELMQEQGYSPEQIFENKKVVARNEATRVNRGALTGGGRMPAKAERTVQLSKDDLEFCKNNELDPKDYAREKLALENNKRGD